ncbi:hypothetical protein K443DRAFT_15756 [Laccaria amethystina LaAM-08-1]|uniref:Uncharacterized protein n=1 Tax=Laccaria amethystina LaAM-08-1 TaxID=1095629 RepID=A0A0C9WWX8_9AGAR|nr:hypothetical protein K443DRAFT_15756 [Laccaria amethystina LaAM-08-1]
MPFTPSCSSSSSPIVKPFLVNVVLDAAHGLYWMQLGGVDSSPMYASTLKRPLSFPLPATFQEGAGKEAMISTMRASSMKSLSDRHSMPSVLVNSMNPSIRSAQDRR